MQVSIGRIDRRARVALSSFHANRPTNDDASLFHNNRLNNFAGEPSHYNRIERRSRARKPARAKAQSEGQSNAAQKIQNQFLFGADFIYRIVNIRC